MLLRVWKFLNTKIKGRGGGSNPFPTLFRVMASHGAVILDLGSIVFNVHFLGLMFDLLCVEFVNLVLISGTMD